MFLDTEGVGTRCILEIFTEGIGTCSLPRYLLRVWELRCSQYQGRTQVPTPSISISREHLSSHTLSKYLGREQVPMPSVNISRIHLVPTPSVSI
jgi:hypothetical protein